MTQEYFSSLWVNPVSWFYSEYYDGNHHIINVVYLFSSF